MGSNPRGRLSGAAAQVHRQHTPRAERVCERRRRRRRTRNGKPRLYHGDQTDSQRSENDRSQEREDEGLRRPCSLAENWLTSGPSQIREELEEKRVTPPRSPARSEESNPAEVPAEGSRPEVIRRGGMDRYHLRSCISAPEKLKDYVCE
ncbi:hypothetical protein NDU88_004951 [Pleurodeles waltl]|uniref:Uncharacterized protein n=1 Tax=Pleurodeles waltl TaxID=8319 RepID=A0AAV7MW27_PLEWA|nr:hypothetical protein NDU88_004951 [Pleurodeles waltl]